MSGKSDGELWPHAAPARLQIFERSAQYDSRNAPVSIWPKPVRESSPARVMATYAVHFTMVEP